VVLYLRCTSVVPLSPYAEGTAIAVPLLDLCPPYAEGTAIAVPPLDLCCTMLDMLDLKRVLLYLMLDMLDLGCSG